MEGGGVKVGTIGPDNGVALGIEPYGGEGLFVPQWTKKLASQHGQKIDFPYRFIVEAHPQDVIADLLKGSDLGDKVRHGSIQWWDGKREAPGP